jgi:pyruvate/2-oxoglutarate dehydrogenase complex dihydrolipoamide dehydrogenase (E3) component
VEGTHLLAASGRLPNTDGIGMDLAGVELTRDGGVKSMSGWRRPRLESGLSAM